MTYLNSFIIAEGKKVEILEENPVVLSIDILGSNFNFNYYNPQYLSTIRDIEEVEKERIVQLEPDIAKVTRITGWSTTEHVQYLDEEKDDISTAIPFLRVQNVLPYKIDLEYAETKYITKEAHEQLKTSQIKPGDVILTITGFGSVGNACVVPDGFRECNASQEIVRIRVKNKLSPHYLVAFLNSALGRHQLWRLQTGSSRPRTLIKNVRKIKIILPKDGDAEKVVVEKAKHIENEIKRIEDKIRTCQIEISNLIATRLNFIITPKEWVYFDANLSERFDVKYYDPKINELYQAMELKSKEMGFECLTIGELVTIPKKPEKAISGKIIKYYRWDPSKRSSPDGKYSPDLFFKHVRISDVDYRFCEITSFSEYLGSEAPSRARIVLRNGDIITATSGSATGTEKHKTAVVTADFDGAIATTGFTNLTIRKDENGNPRVPPYYLVALLRSNFVLFDIKRRTRGATIPSINEDHDLLNVKVPLPSPEERVIIAETTHRLIHISKDEIAQLETMRSTITKEIEQLILS